MQPQISSVLVNISEACTVGCAHCGYHGSDRASRADPKKLDDWIEQVAVLGVPMVIFTGGEPFQDFELLRQGIHSAAERKLKVGVFTSGFWGRNSNVARRRLAELPGLTHLYISVDKFHQDVVNIKCAQNVIKAALDASIAEIIVCMTYHSEEEIGECKSHLGDVFKDRRVRIHAAAVIPNPYHDTSGIPENASTRSLENYRLKRTCYLQTPLIEPDGGVFACHIGKVSAHRSAHISPYLLGTLNNNNLADIFSSAENSPTYKYLRAFGPSGVAKFAELVLKRPPSELRRDCANECSMCYSVLGDSSIFPLFEAFVNEPEVQEDADVALAFGLGERAIGASGNSF